MNNNEETIQQFSSSIEEQTMIDEIVESVAQVLDDRVNNIIENFNVDDSVVNKIETASALEEQVN